MRLRDFGATIGTMPVGRFNAITDVEGVQVGHTTLVRGDGALVVGEGPVRTGVTAILPNGGRIFEDRVMASAFVLNGAGELSGVVQLIEWGLLETPIILTNTHSVGTSSEAVVRYMVERNGGIGSIHDVLIPVVGECDDSWLNDVSGHHVSQEDVWTALDNAAGGDVAEGSVGGGTGMITCDLNAGIGTSSRVVATPGGDFHVGVLVMSNFGVLEQLRLDGLPLGRFLESRIDLGERRRVNYGSIISVVATDAPMMPSQLTRLAKRSALGIGRAGSTALHGSGEIVLAFSTTNAVPRGESAFSHKIEFVAESHINPFYQASIEATEEAILNSLVSNETMVGRDGHIAHGLPHDELRAFLALSDNLYT